MKDIPKDIGDYIEYIPSTGQLIWATCTSTRVSPGDIAGSNRGDGYQSVRFRGKDYQAHRIAWFLYHGKQPKMLDHINRDRKDNKLSNLREANSRLNQYNTLSVEDSSSRFKGVSFRPDTKKWRARISNCGENIDLGYFLLEEEAAEAYTKAAKKLHKEFYCE